MPEKLVRIGDVVVDVTCRTAHRLSNGRPYRKIGPMTQIPVAWDNDDALWVKIGPPEDILKLDELVEFIPAQTVASIQPAGFV